MSNSIRDYGLGETKVKGKPKVMGNMECGEGCPNCGCETIYIIEVEVESASGMGPGVGKYVGCPACPWASPCVTTIKRQSNGKEEKEQQR